MQSIQKNNKKTKKMSLFMKISCIRPYFSMEKRYFS